MNKQVKSMVTQWIAPAGVLVLALILMLLNFSTKSRVSVNNTVTRNMITNAEKCASLLCDDIVLMEEVGKPIADILSATIGSNTDKKALEQDLTYAVKALRAAKENCGAYMVYMCDGEGNAVNYEGDMLSLAEAAFYDKVQEADGIKYIYNRKDEKNEADDIIVSIPIDSESGEKLNLLLFYTIANYDAIVRKFDFYIWSFETLIDKEGNIIVNYGNASGWNKGDNIFDSLQDENADIMTKLKSQVAGNISAMLSVNMGDKKNALVYTPLGAGGWTLVCGIPQSNIDRQIEQQWATFKNMVYQLVIVILVFIVFVVTINIASKVLNSRKQEQLETKADTDLLTGLNNKLATERKIKEFIAENPNTQSMMFIFDIDNFKKINDTMGHAFGDEVLRSLGQQIRVIFRVSDIVGRAGGDEFIVFLKNISDGDIIRKEAQKVEDFFKDFKAGEYTKYAATASIGCAIYPQEGKDFESIYKAADAALYKAKKRGKKQLAFYNDEWAGDKNE